MDLVEDRPEVPVPQAVAEEQQVTVQQPCHDRLGQHLGEIGAGQVLDVVVFGDHVAVIARIGA